MTGHGALRRARGAAGLARRALSVPPRSWRSAWLPVHTEHERSVLAFSAPAWGHRGLDELKPQVPLPVCSIAVIVSVSDG